MVSNVLTVQGTSIINAQGQPVVLRGFNIGGWMNMENFITGYPANEEAQRQAIRDVLGEETYAFFFDRFLEYFFGRDDAQYIASLGLNLLRLPINYRHFESDMEPFVIKEEGFKHLDRVINLCAEQQIYTIIDLHALPGYQNQDWHSDNPSHKAFFWQHKHFQDRVVHLWEAIATRYKDHPWVAGYNPINEPADPSEAQVEPFYRRLYQAIRAIDPNHILFLEGNRYSLDFHMFKEPLPREFLNYNPFPFGANWMIRRLVRYILLAEPLLEEYAALFKGMSKSEIDEMMQSFQFKQCVQHTELANILAESSRESSRS